MEFRHGRMTARIRRATAAAACAAATLIAGCGGGGGGAEASSPPIETAGPGDVALHFPMAVGDRWVYRKTSSDGTDALKADFMAETRTVQGLTAVVSRRQDVASGQIEAGDGYYTKTGRGVYALASDLSPASGWYGQSRVEVLRFPLEPGTQHVPVDQTDLDFGADLDGDGRNERLSARVQTTVEATEPVTVSAGTFANAARVVTVVKETVTLSRNNQTLSGTTTYTDWYAPGVGLVRNREVGVYPDQTFTDELELVAYSVGGQQQPASAPTVTSVAPADGSTVLSSAWSGPIVLNLSGNLSGDTVAQRITVRSSQGVPVPGETFRAASDRLEFRPAAPLTPDTYAVTLGSGLLDVLGRAVKPSVSTTFTVVAPDVTAPSIVGLDTRFGGTAGAPDATLALTFSEPLAPDSVTPAAFALDSGGLRYPVRTATLTGPSQVTLQVELDPGQPYTIATGTPLTDRAGNPATGLGPAFRTAGGFGSFYAPRNYSSGRYPYALQAGDVDGDGRADLVLAVGAVMFDLTTTAELHLYPHQSGAPLEPMTAVPLPLASTCLPNLMTLADATGDGRTDIVVGAGDCGVLVLERSTGGSWSVTSTVAMPSAGHLLLADVNGDGRQDLVTAANGDYALNIAHGRPGGGFGAVIRQAVPTPIDYPSPAYFHGLAAGDLDSDGRTDLVALPHTTESAQTVQFLRQRSDGTFAPAIYLPPHALNPSAGTHAALIGDLNGDGRADLVVSGGQGAASHVLVYWQDAAGVLGAPVRLDTGESPVGLSLVDMDGNGRRDLVVQHLGSYARLGAYLQTREGTLRSEQLIESASYWSTWRGAPVLGDFNGDGLLDFASSDYGWFRVQYQRPADTITATATATAFGAALAAPRASALQASRRLTPAGPHARFGTPVERFVRTGKR